MLFCNYSRIATALVVCVAAISPVLAHEGAHASDAAAAPRAYPPAANRYGANYFPNVPLVTQDGTQVHFYDDLLKGKSVAINLIYTRCKDECPLETARMVQVQHILGEHMGKDIFFYSLSIDPDHDTPEVLKAYAEKFHVGPGWLFLTGKKDDITLVAKKLGLSRRTDLINPDGHSASLMVGDEPHGQWMRNSAEDNPPFLAGTIGTFLGWKQATAGKSYSEARPLALSKGEYIFKQRCSTCHTIGNGVRIGPDLLGVTSRRESAWLARYIQVPDRVLDAHDPIAVALSQKYDKTQMPNLGLGSEDVDALIVYLEAQSAGPRKVGENSSADARSNTAPSD